MEYLIIYDISEAGFKSLGFAASGLIFIAIGIGLVIFRNHLPNQGPRILRKIFPFFFLGFSIIWTSTAFLSTWNDYSSAKNALNLGNQRLVEGKVYDFIPMPYEGHAKESFKVDGREFFYSDYIITAGFNNTSSHGGPIREGLEVKIWHCGNTILKLGVKK